MKTIKIFGKTERKLKNKLEINMAKAILLLVLEKVKEKTYLV